MTTGTNDGDHLSKAVGKWGTVRESAQTPLSGASAAKQ